MGKITGWHAGQKSEIDKIRDDMRDIIEERSIVEFGRPDIPDYVQREAESYALDKRVSNREALEALIAGAGSLKALVIQVAKKRKKLNKKSQKTEKEISEASSLRKLPATQFQKVIDASKQSKYVSIVLGGAPGLGKKA